MILVKANESTASKRRVFFHLVDATDGITPETGEAGGQPQVSINGAAWTNTGIGVLVAIGNGRYYAELTQTLVATAGTIIETRFKSANTAECPGDSVQVVAFDPHDAAGLGLSRVDAAVSSRAEPGDEMDVVDSAVTAIQAGLVTTDDLPDNFSVLDINASGHISRVALADALTSNNDKSGYSLATPPPTASAVASAVWSETTRTLTAFSFLTTSGIADAVWDEDITTHTTTDSAGEALRSAGSAGDPWATPLPGSYTSGQAGYIVGNNLDATVSSRASATDISDLESHGDGAWATATGFLTSGDLPDNFSVLAINASGHILRVTLVDTTTTNTDMRGTDGAVTSLMGIATSAQVKEVKDYFDEMTEDDGGGNTRWTAKSLEEAPTGGGGGGNPWSLPQEDNKDAGTMGESLFLAAQAAGGAGSIIVTITVESGGNPLDGVSCFLSTDTAGGNRITNARFTDGMGQVTFLLDPGQYYLWRQHNQFEFPNPVSLVVEADGSFLLGG